MARASPRQSRAALPLRGLCREQAYAALTERLKDDIKHMEDVAADVTTAKQALEKSGCNLSKLDTALDDLQN